MHKSPTSQDIALQEVPEAWFEQGPFRAFIPAWLGGLVAGYTLKYSGIDPHPYVEAATSVAVAAGASLLDRKSSRDLLDSMETAREIGIHYDYTETNELVGDVRTREDFIRSTRSAKILGLEGVFLAGSAYLGWPFAAPVAAIRGIAAANNRRKIRRIDVATTHAQDAR